MAFRLGDPDAIRTGTTPSATRAWSTTTEIVVGGWASFFALMWGLILGASSLGEEFKERTADFLLVRPRRRPYWVWTGWSVGVSELTVMVFLAVGASFGTLLYLTGHVQTWWLLATTLPLAVGGAVAYGLTYFTTLVVRSGRLGLSYGVGILFIDILLPPAMSYYWNVNFPSVLGFMMAACKWTTSASEAFPSGALVLWTAIALAFPFAAQLVLERAEV
jgi:ABC-type transport system involved in multi-copper enzyme maturation permease subunit